MTVKDALRSWGRANGMNRLRPSMEAARWNQRHPTPSGPIIDVPFEIVDQPTPPGPEGGTKQHDHVEYDDRGAAR